MSDSNVSRRAFVRGAAVLGAGVMIVPRHVLGGPLHRAPSTKLNIAIVGVGGMGFSNMSQLLDENVVALADVDFPFVERQLAGRMRTRDGQAPSAQQVQLKAAYEKATKYADYREMLAKHRDLDAVLVATPDHTHAAIAVAAMRAGKHVYVQKPLTYSVGEARLLAKVAAETGVATQMGNQGHSMEGTRRIVEIVRAGVLGPIRAVHVWTDRPVGYWAQGVPRPGQGGERGAAPYSPTDSIPPRWNAGTVQRAVLRAMADQPQSPPRGLDWDLFLGPVPEVPYHPAYHPFSWRGWVHFGGGSLGDMGAHLMDQPYWALGLTQPTTVAASSTPWGGPNDDPASYPLAMTADYEFPAVGDRPAVELHWYDGGLLPPRPAMLPDSVVLPKDGGGVLVGERGILTYETYGNNPTVYPERASAAAAAVPKTLPRVEGSHEMNWVQAAKGEGTASAPFAYAAALTETMLLGVAALRAGQGRKLRYDASAMSFTNAPDADRLLTRAYRAGWGL